MKIKGLRWGNDGGGIACGPTGGSMIAELIVETVAGKNVFVTASVMDNFEHITVTESPAFDAWVDIAQAEALHELFDSAIENYDFEIDEDFSEDEFAGSDYLSAIQFVRFALNQYAEANEDLDQQDADAFISQCQKCGTLMKKTKYYPSWVDEAEEYSAIMDDNW